MSREVSDRALSVLIVSYKSPDLLKRCLDSVTEHAPELPILVWDNSGPDCPGMAELVDSYPGIRWQMSDRNIGFAAAVNALARQIPGQDLLLLNPDAVLLGPLNGTRAAIRQPGIAAAAPLARNDVDRAATLGRGSHRRPWDVAHRQLNLARALVSSAGYAEKWRTGALSDLYPNRPVDVDGYLTGACLAVSREAWDAVGPFDEEFFLYGEESDWQWRARTAGWGLRLVDEAGIVHESSGTVAGDPLARKRSHDLLRANVALNLEHECGVHQADAYLAGASLLDRVQRSKRRELGAWTRQNGAVRKSNRPSVIITTNRLVHGGAERQHVLLATELDRRGYEVVIACMQRFGPLISEVPSSIRVVRQPWWAPAVDVAPGPSVLIGGDTNTEAGFATLWRRGRRDRRWLVAAHIPPRADGPTYSRGLGAAMRSADGFIALSERHWREATAHQALGSRWYTAPNGVARQEDLDSTATAAERSVPGRPLRLAMLSRIVEHKNPHLLVEALAGVREHDWELSIFGDGPDRARLEGMTPATVADRVHWRGWSPGPEHALADCDLLCVPSRAEAFPLVILEAMARGIPVIASAVCAVPDMLDGGNAGVLVDPVTLEAWRSALERVLSRPESLPELGYAGFVRMRKLYTVEAMADAYEEAINRSFDAADGAPARRAVRR